MGICSSCGNDYANTFEITLLGKKCIFDCFECAIHKLAPICQGCGCKILGHDIEANGSLYCCTHCLKKSASNANAKMSTIEK